MPNSDTQPDHQLHLSEIPPTLTGLKVLKKTQSSFLTFWWPVNLLVIHFFLQVPSPEAAHALPSLGGVGSSCSLMGDISQAGPEHFPIFHQY